MLYRRAGIRHIHYRSDKQLWPLGFDRVLVALVAGLAAAAPFVFPALYVNGYLLPLVVWSTAALGLNLLMGFAGQIHLGYAAVMAMGAYGSVHLARMGVPFEAAVLGGGLISAAVGMVFGGAALRVKGIYLAISTLAMQYIVDYVITHVGAISGGTQATLQAPRFSVLGLPVESDLGRYYTALLACAVVTLFMLNVRRTAYGRALATVRDKDYAAEMIGVDSFLTKLSAFWTSSFIGGVAGAMLAFCYYKAITPEQFNLDMSIQAVAMVIVGGMGTVLGGFFGAALILLAPIGLNNLVAFAAAAGGIGMSTEALSHIPLALYGALIIGFLLAEPLGLAKLYDNVRNYFLVWPFRHARP